MIHKSNFQKFNERGAGDGTTKVNEILKEKPVFIFVIAIIFYCYYILFWNKISLISLISPYSQKILDAILY